MFGSSGSLRDWKPSPPLTMYQSLVRTPSRLSDARRPAEREVVLRAAADVVERLRVVDRDAVELRDRQVREEAPGLAFVVRLVEPAVVAEQDVVAIDRIELERVMIDVDAGALEFVWCQVLPPSVLRSRLTLTDQIVSARYGSAKISW